MVCLETTFLIDILKGDPGVKDIMNSLERNILLPASPSVMELWSGALLADLPEKEKEKIGSLLESLAVLPLDEAAAKGAGEIEVSLLKKGEMIDVEDVMIAAIAITNGEKLVSRDPHYARVKNLRLEKY